MLSVRPNCECCDRDLGPASDEASICSFEGTFCEACASGPLGGVCPNCGGAYSYGWNYAVGDRQVAGGATRILEIIPQRATGHRLA